MLALLAEIEAWLAFVFAMFAERAAEIALTELVLFSIALTELESLFSKIIGY